MFVHRWPNTQHTTQHSCLNTSISSMLYMHHDGRQDGSVATTKSVSAAGHHSLSKHTDFNTILRVG